MKANKRNPLLWMSLPATTALLLAWLFFFVAAGAQAGSPQLLGNSLGVADGPAAPTAPSAVGPADLFFSEYIEGSSNNKALEIYNGTGAEITFSGHYTVALYSNGSSTPGNILTLDGSIAAGDVYVIANASAVAAIKDIADVTSTVTYFNGDDAIALYKDGVLLDVIGKIGEDPGTKWGTEPNTTVEHTLVRKSGIFSGDTDGSDAFDPVTEWDASVQDTFDYLGSHDIVCITDLFFSEYIEGSSNNKALEIYNGTGAEITFSGHYTVALYSNGSSTPGNILTLDGSIAAGDVYVIANASAVAAIKDIADVTSSVTYFNGDDAIALYKDGVLLDVIGKIGEDPGTKWGTEPNTTVEHTLVRKSNVISGDTDGSDAFDPATEWDAYAQNTFDYLGSHSVTVCGLGIVPGDLIVGKSGPSAAPAGDQIIYQITLENTAAATATNVIFTDTLPIGTTYVSDDSGVTPGKPSSQTYVWDLVEIGPTTVVTIHLTVDADARLAPGSMLTNWITATTSLDDDDPDTNSASWQTTISELVSIHDIQFVTDPGSDDASPYEGQTVFVEGIVTAEPGEIDTGTKTFVIEAPGGGPWSGLTVFCNGGFSGLSAPEGTEVRVLGKVSEYYGMTELTVSGGAADVTVLSTGNPLPSPDVLDTSDFDDVGAAISEQWESVLVQFQDATVTELLNYEEWHFDDGTGAARADDLGEIDGDLTYQPEVGDEYDTIRGIGWYSYDNYKLMPRYDSDIGFAYPSIYKDAPTLVAPGELFTYTIRVKNNFTYTLTDVVVSDTIPANAEFAYALDGGLETGGVVSWTVSNLGAFSSVQVRFAVTATSQVTDIVNSDYAVVAGNFTTSVQGDPVLTVVAHEMRIHDIQRSQHLSPFEDRLVWAVQGIVTAVGDKRFFMQDPTPDADEATSEGIQVYVDAAPGVSVGDLVSVTGTVEEYYPGGIGTGNLSTTQLGNPTVAVLSSGNSLPAATVIGIGGRLPPTTVIDGDATGNVDERQPLDPVKNGIDFYESLEAMLVQVNDAHVVGGTNNYGEIAVVSDGAANAGEMTARGGIVIQADDFNPERVIIDDALYGAEPKVDVGDQFSGPVVGVLDYDFGNFKLLNTAALPPTTGFLAMEITSLTRQADQISIATFNVENLYPGDTARFPLLAQRIVLNLGAPDIIGLQEIQDNNGETDNGTTDASQTYQALIDAIKLIGGPTYEYREIAPLDNQDGGAPGANIRVGFLFRADRGLSFIDRSGGDAVTATAAVIGASGVELTYSPGRIDPTNLAFFDSRKPLAGEFLFNDQKLFVVVNHLNSKGGDTPLFGRLQPPVLSSEAQRIQQAQVINDFVDSILALDPGAKVVVLGDLNDFQFSPPLDALKGAVLADLIENLPIAEQYTYIYDGNSQVLDHILVSDKLALDGALVDIVHVNAEFNAAFRVSDHDPVLALLRILPYRILFPLVFR